MISPELLRRFALFGGLPHELLDAIAQFSNDVTFEPDTYLFEQGDVAKEVFLVVDGAVDLLIDMNEQGERREEIETVIAGEVVGWSALTEPYNYTLSAVTTKPTRVIIIDAPAFRVLLEAHPDWGFRVMGRMVQIVGKRLSHMRMRLISASI